MRVAVSRGSRSASKPSFGDRGEVDPARAGWDDLEGVECVVATPFADVLHPGIHAALALDAGSLGLVLQSAFSGSVELVRRGGVLDGDVEREALPRPLLPLRPRPACSEALSARPVLALQGPVRVDVEPLERGVHGGGGAAELLGELERVGVAVGVAEPGGVA